MFSEIQLVRKVDCTCVLPLTDYGLKRKEKLKQIDGGKTIYQSMNKQTAALGKNKRSRLQGGSMISKGISQEDGTRLHKTEMRERKRRGLRLADN